MTIRNAANFDLSDSPGTLPNMTSALLDYFQKMTFSKITKTTVNFQLVEKAQVYYTKGVRQPLKPQAILMKPEGQRKWVWEMLHILPDVVLGIDDVVDFKGTRYRVMSRSDYTEYGFLQYEIAQDYAP